MSNINEKYGYQPYTGGAGPTLFQIHAFGSLLSDVLAANRIPFTVESEEESDSWIVVHGRRVQYDRWGYVSDDGVLDQVDLDTAFRYLSYQNMTMRQLTAWCDAHADDEEARDLLYDYRADAAAEREQFGDPEDTPCLEQPWWRNP